MKRTLESKLGRRSTRLARRTVLAAALGAAGATLCMGAAAQSPAWPSKPITLVVGLPPGGAADIVGRTVAEKLAPALGQPVIVDNRAGGATSIASKYVLAAPPDGYTLYIYLPSFATNNILNPKVFNFDPVKDFTPIANITRAMTVLVVNPNLPVKNVKELIELARAKPGEILFGNIGQGSSDHLSGLLLAQQAGVKFTSVPYKAGPQAHQDLIAGNLHVRFDAYATARPLIESGKIRALAHGELGRAAAAPNLPAIAETLPGFSYGADFSLLGPKGMPQPIVERLHKEIVDIMKMPDVAAKLTAMGMEPRATSPQELSRLMQSEIDRYAKVIKDANITLQE